MRRPGRRTAGVLVVLALAVALATTPVGSWVLGLLEAARGSPWALPVWALVFTVGAVVAVPASAGWASAGFLFGPVRGLIVAWVAMGVWSTLDFALARRWFRDAIATRVAGDPRMSRLDRWIAERGPMAVVLLRLSPASPFHIVSFALGCTPIRPGAHLAGTMLGAALPVGLYVFGGASVPALSSMDGAGVLDPTAAAVGLGATVVATGGLLLYTRRLLREVLDAGDDPAAPPPGDGGCYGAGPREVP